MTSCFNACDVTLGSSNLKFSIVFEVHLCPPTWKRFRHPCPRPPPGFAYGCPPWKNVCGRPWQRSLLYSTKACSNVVVLGYLFRGRSTLKNMRQVAAIICNGLNTVSLTKSSPIDYQVEAKILNASTDTDGIIVLIWSAI